MTLVCSQGTTPNIAVSLGSNPLLTVRRMTDGTNFLAYSVFRPTSNAAGATCTGATVDYPDTAPGFGLPAAPSTASRTFNLCGQIAAGLSIPIGTYNDTVVATVTF